MSECNGRIGGLDSVVRAAIGPRQPGGTYRNGYLNLEYRVEEILAGDAARELIPFADFAIVQIDMTGSQPGRRRVHCTSWNPRRDEVVQPPDTEPGSSRLVKP